MTMNRRLQAALLISVAAIGQAQIQEETAPGSPARRTGVDGVIALVNAGISEQMIIRRLQQEGKAYELTTDDLVKLKKGGVPETIIEIMIEPKPEAALAATPAPKEEKKKGLWGRLREDVSSRAKRTGQNTLDTTERTAGKTLDSAEQKANQTVEGAQQKADRTVQSSLGAGQQTADSTVQKGTGATSQPQPTGTQSRR
jgi:hypothetical protein